MHDVSRRRAEDIAKGLYPHQIEGIVFLLGRRRALLADDMGLGKTRQSVVEGSILMPDGETALELDVLSELKRLMNALSVQTTELEASELHDVLQKAGEAYLEENAAHLREATRVQLRPYSEEAIRTLAQVLTGPEKYHRKKMIGFSNF